MFLGMVDSFFFFFPVMHEDTHTCMKMARCTCLQMITWYSTDILVMVKHQETHQSIYSNVLKDTQCVSVEKMLNVNRNFAYK